VQPRFGEYASVHTPHRIAVFARDLPTRDLVWTRDKGYPGDPSYMDHAGDIGLHWDPQYVAPLTHGAGRMRAGIRYYVRGNTSGKTLYDPAAALARCNEHAHHFVQHCQWQVSRLRAGMDRKPVIVAMFDMEHFGHWWWEGPAWLNLVVRKLACEQDTVRMVLPEEYLDEYPTNQAVAPSASSWGYQGYSETWLMGRNHWVYPRVYRAIDAFRGLAASGKPRDEFRLAALGQYLRELLLAQTSDWPYAMHAETVVDYAGRRVNDHLANMKAIETGLEKNTLTPKWLARLREKHHIFGDIDLLDRYQSCVADMEEG
jgi:1,4-alpha-glucan branching enzyme